MQATIISTVRTNTEEEHTTDPGQSGTEHRMLLRISLEDMAILTTNAYYRGPAPGWIPNYAKVTEVLYTGYGDPDISHYRTVEVSGYLLKKDGSLGKLATDDNWRIYSTEDEAKLPVTLQETLSQVVPAFRKGTLPA